MNEEHTRIRDKCVDIMGSRDEEQPFIVRNGINDDKDRGINIPRLAK